MDLQRHAGRPFAVLVEPCLQSGRSSPSRPRPTVVDRGICAFRQLDILSLSVSQPRTASDQRFLSPRQRRWSARNAFRFTRVEDVSGKRDLSQAAWAMLAVVALGSMRQLQRNC